MYCYHAFSLTIHSELELPELTPALNTNQSTAPIQPEVLIQWGAVSLTGLEQPLAKGVTYEADEQSLWLHVPHIARYLVSHGSTITIDPIITNDESSIRLFLLGSCLGALLMQRRLFLLHANAIKIGAHCVAFAGVSGAGKSTLSAAFLQQGYAILADDVCAINQQCEVIPGFPQIKLWADASQKLSINTQSLRKVRPDLEKYAVPLGPQFHSEALPLRVIYLLQSHNKETIEFVDLSAHQKFTPLKNNTYRMQYLKGLDKGKIHIKQCGAIASKTQVVRLTRPNHGFMLNELIDAIQSDLLTRGLTRA
jgi:hypothetical protein